MIKKSDHYIRGRGAHSNPANRFSKFNYEQDEFDGEDTFAEMSQKTKFIEVFPKTIVNKVLSPDVGMDYSVNPYQGCEHGCTYCYARPTHEYWGYSAGIDFERIIMVKKNAAQLLAEAFMKKSWKVKPVVFSGNTDCYQPCERNYAITRELLKVCLQFRNPVGIITKNVLLYRDLDLLEELASLNLVSIHLSITTLDETLRRNLEPRTATARRKLELVSELSKRKIPITVMAAPIIPALNDHELMSIAKEASHHGADRMSYHVVRLNGPIGDIFEKWLSHSYPDRASKVINQLKEIHGGKVSSSDFGERMKGKGAYALNIKRQFELAKQKYFPENIQHHLRTDLFTRSSTNRQFELFNTT